MEPTTATIKGDLKRVKMLIGEVGIDREKVDNNGETLLHEAARLGRVETTRYLLEQGADKDKASNYGQTPLHWAAYFGHLEVARLLMRHGACLNLRTKAGELPIDMTQNEQIKKAILDEPRRRKKYDKGGLQDRILR